MMISKNYSFQQIGEKYIVSILNHCEIFSTINSFCKDQNIKVGTISGIGAVNEVTLRFFNPLTKEYEDKQFMEQMEIANLTGNISTLNGEIYLHLHVVLGRSDYSAIAGHLMTAQISGAGEFVIEKLTGVVERCYSPEIGLNIYHIE